VLEQTLFAMLPVHVEAMLRKQPLNFLPPLYQLVPLTIAFFDCFPTEAAHRFVRLVGNTVYVTVDNQWTWYRVFEDGIGYYCFPIKWAADGLWVPATEVFAHLQRFSTESLNKYFNQRPGASLPQAFESTVTVSISNLRKC